MADRHPRRKLFLIVLSASIAALLIGAIGCLMLIQNPCFGPFALIGAIGCLMLIQQKAELTWEQAFNKEHGTALGIDIHEGHHQHLVKFDFTKNPNGQVTQYEAITCWADAGSPKLQEDAWALFSDQARRYGNGIKFTVKEAPTDPRNGRPLEVMVVTLFPYKPLSPQEAQERALMTIEQLKKDSPCKRD